MLLYSAPLLSNSSHLRTFFIPLRGFAFMLWLYLGFYHKFRVSHQLLCAWKYICSVRHRTLTYDFASQIIITRSWNMLYKTTNFTTVYPQVTRAILRPIRLVPAGNLAIDHWYIPCTCTSLRCVDFYNSCCYITTPNVCHIQAKLLNLSVHNIAKH